MRVSRTCAYALVCAITALASGVSAVDLAAQDHPGKVTYDRWCAGCHGVDGTGNGPAAGYMLPRPRDFTTARYQIRTTASGEMPTDADLMRVIDDGMPGTAMPGWRDALSQTERQNLVGYLKTFSRFFENANPTPIDFGSAPRATPERLADGAQVYQDMECFRCHGQAGRGDGTSAPTQADDSGFPIRPADLTEPWHFNGGGSAEDVFHRFRTGLNGTPMPSYSDVLDAGIVTEDQLWNLALYVQSLGGETPPVREVILAGRVEEALPAGPDDEAWSAADRYYIPLVGQIVIKPRWFSPGVDGIWVQALHDGTDLAMRISWSDPSRSPAPEWMDWRTAVEAVMEPHEAPVDSMAMDSVPVGLPDALAVQFPRTVPTGAERPYFLMGNARSPVYLWHWSSQAGAPTEMTGRGLGTMASLGASNGLTGSAVFGEGQWRVMMRRPLQPADTTSAIALPTGQPVPIAFFAWDGDNGETGTRGSVSSWYYVQLEEPTPATVYATPVVLMLLTAGLGLFAVGRAQKRERESDLRSSA